MIKVENEVDTMKKAKVFMKEGLSSVDSALKIESSKKDESFPRHLNDADTVMLLRHVRNKPRERIIIEMLLFTGIRVSELLSIKISDINLDKKLFCIRKGRGIKRFICILPQICELIKEYLSMCNNESPYLFYNQKGNPLSNNWATKLFKRLSKELNLNITPYMLRHFFIDVIEMAREIRT